MTDSERTEDWTRGAAKAGAIVILGIAAVVGVAWSIATRPQSPPPSMPETAVEAVLGPVDAPDEPPILRINPNVDTAERLAMLPGVGGTLSQRIVDERESGGPFTSADDLARVQGIGDRTVDRLRPYLVFSPANRNSD